MATLFRFLFIAAVFCFVFAAAPAQAQTIDAAKAAELMKVEVKRDTLTIALMVGDTLAIIDTVRIAADKFSGLTLIIVRLSEWGLARKAEFQAKAGKLMRKNPNGGYTTILETWYENPEHSSTVIIRPWKIMSNQR